jgi:hypothetical protein
MEKGLVSKEPTPLRKGVKRMKKILRNSLYLLSILFLFMLISSDISSALQINHELGPFTPRRTHERSVTNIHSDPLSSQNITDATNGTLIFNLQLGPFTLPKTRGGSVANIHLGDFVLDSLPSQDITSATISGVWSGLIPQGSHIYLYAGDIQVADIFSTTTGKRSRNRTSTNSNNWSYTFSEAEEDALQGDFLDDGLVNLSIVGSLGALKYLGLGKINFTIVDVLPTPPGPSGSIAPTNGVPEPTTMLLLGSGLLGLWGARKKFKK